MLDQEKHERTDLYALLSLHEALIAVLYADHIEHDKKLRDVREDPAQSLDAFRQYTRYYLEDRFSRLTDTMVVQVREAALEKAKGFFKDVELILAKRQQPS